MTKADPQTDRKGLIGHTGFVGGHLARQAGFDAVFNTANIAQLHEQSFDTIVCAAAPGSMFEANKAPERDYQKISALIRHLSKAKTSRFILISSIAVLADFAGGDDESTTRFQVDLAYGRHRRELEAFVAAHFPDHLIVRLPALFGSGLRKNFIFDLLNPVPSMLTAPKIAQLLDLLPANLAGLLRGLYANDPATGMFKLDRTALDRDPARAALDAAVIAQGFSAMQFHNPASTFQYYDMTRLWPDIGIARQAGLRQVHLATAPLRAGHIYRHVTGQEMPQSEARLHREDMRTRHAGLWGQKGDYLEGADVVLEKLARFFRSESPPA